MSPPIVDGEAASRPLTVAKVLRARIVAGQYTEGERLVEDRLAKEFGVSRIPIREAFRILAAEGFLRLVPYRGAFIDSVDRQSAENVLEIRRALEPVAAYRAALNRDDDDIELLERLYADGMRAMERGNFEQLPSLNSKLHGVMWSASGNRELQTLLEQLGYKIAWVYSLTARRRAKSSWQEHLELLTAIKDGDQSLAKKLMVDHIDAAAEAQRLRPNQSRG